jgi:Na+-transporting NADH:ubiquinone oxidoreductase subunit B
MTTALGWRPVRPIVGMVGPKVRSMVTLARLHSLLLLALAPCLFLGAYNVGRQANAAIAGAESSQFPSWYLSVVESFSGGRDAAGVLSVVALGVLLLLPVVLTALITAELWRRVFARTAWAEALGFAATAVMFTLALPPTIAPWQVALGLSFGLVLGKEIFGGTGMNFLNPALVGLAFLYFSYPDAMRGPEAWAVGGAAATPPFSIAAGAGFEGLHAADVRWLAAFLGLVPGPIGAASTLGCVLGAVILLLARFISWRVVAGSVLGLVATAWFFVKAAPAGLPAATLPWYWHLNIGGFAYALVFLACDPVTSATTNCGRWIYGLFVGAMTVVIRVVNTTQTDPALLAVLLGGIVAPLIDYVVTRRNIRRRRQRCA